MIQKGNVQPKQGNVLVWEGKKKPHTYPKDAVKVRIQLGLTYCKTSTEKAASCLSFAPHSTVSWGKGSASRLKICRKLRRAKCHLCWSAVRGHPGDSETEGCPEELALPVTASQTPASSAAPGTCRCLCGATTQVHG